MIDLGELTAWCGETNTTHLVVQLDGERVVDRSWGIDPLTPHDVGSIQKVLTGVVLGQLVTTGDLSLDQPINDIIGPDWSQTDADHERAITIGHLATMTAGLDDDFRPIHEPATDWYYCNRGYHLLRHAIETVAGEETDALFRRRIFEPCGMEVSSFALRDPDDPNSLPGLRSNGHDIARLGTALLEPGALGVDAELIQRMRAGTRPNPSYGHLCWTYAGRSAVVTGHRPGQAVVDGRLFGGIRLDRPIAGTIPVDAFGGTGFGDQRLTVVPSLDLVVVRLGRATGVPAGEYDEAMWSRIPISPHR